MKPEEKLALSNCDREPVHIPGRIQSFGSVIGFDLDSNRLQYHSDNLLTLFPTLREPSFEKSFENLFPQRDIVHAIRGGLGLPSIEVQRDRVGSFEIGSTKTDVALYTANGVAVVELEPDQHVSARPQTPVSVVKSMLATLRTGDGIEALLDSAVKALRHLTGFDRVMGYRFLENGEGEVVAETKGNGIEPFLGLRYPASDIPQQARMLMMRAQFRLISSLEDPHSSITSAGGSPPLDLTLSHLRGVSPIHIEYLQNMGVNATMNTSVVVRGKLWGLFAFHHYRAKKITPDQRSICELFSQLISMQIQQEIEQATFDRRSRAHSSMLNLESGEQTTEEIFTRTADELMGIVGCSGVAIVKETHITAAGATPPKETIRNIVELTTDECTSINELSATAVPEPETLGDVAGALIIKLAHQTHLVFFRNEIATEIRWAGGKEKTITHGPNGPRLTPRGSFAEYIESVSGRCEPWSKVDISGAMEISSKMQKLMHLSSGELSQHLEKQKRYQDLLIAELNHRVRNTLALVRSIARQTKSSTQSLDQYIESLEQRISALSKAHDLIGGSGLQWARIEDLVNAELKPYVDAQANITLQGPKIAVRADVAPIVSLLFHEMTSNAVKHGALSDHGKSLQVSWKEKDGGVAIDWTETLTKEVSEPERRGFGFALIKRAIPYECKGKSTIEFRGDQMAIHFWLPPESVHRLSSAQESLPTKTRSEADSPLKSDVIASIESVMLIEDNMVLAMEMERLLLEVGIKEVDAFPNTELATDELERKKFDAAILDINLGDETSFDLGLKLHKLGTPVVFVSGYDSKYELPEQLIRAPRLTKPVNRTELVLALETARQSVDE
ncbi:MAG: HWE histidine kinase domain-containing protein [Mariniblastus sp.]